MAFLGGSVFNLKGCSMAQGKNHLDVICVFGGFKMTVPEDWNIQIKTISIFGGISDKGQNTHQSQDVIYTNVLIIKGLYNSAAISFGNPHSYNFNVGPTTITERPE